MPESVAKVISAVKGIDPMLGVVIVLLVVILANSYQEFSREERMSSVIIAQNKELKNLVLANRVCAEIIEDELQNAIKQKDTD